ncbi:MAG TPA: FAD-dependent oxidoreductase [Candidatus Saccharimonadales bacterium]|nr:FAD-dependent oxidoreductase [Candidatus Saccharimonadales bacterium]
MQVFFERREQLAPGIWQYYFRPERPVDFVPGQYADLHLTDVSGDPRGSSRVFSFTSLPSDSSVSFVLKHFELQTPYKHRLQSLQSGDEARLDGAMGDLVLPKNPATPLVFVAGGIGIASYASMLSELITRREERPIFLFYALRSRREQIFRELIDGYPLALKSIIIAPNRLTAREIKDSTPPDAFVYLSGSQKFVEGLQADLGALGVAYEQIIFDYFDGYTEL